MRGKGTDLQELTRMKKWDALYHLAVELPRKLGHEWSMGPNAFEQLVVSLYQNPALRRREKRAGTHEHDNSSPR